jgi:uncharacterized protein involved in exopolysaccharide biosynthesis
VTGEHSQFPIARLASKYSELTENGRFLSNQQSMEIIRTRIQQLAERIDQNERPERLRVLRGLWVDFWEAQQAGDALESMKVRQQIDAEFDAVYHDYMSWQQMLEALDLDRKMVESEVKIAKDLKAILTAKDAYELAAKLLAAIIEAANSMIFDTQIRGRFLKRIQYEFARLVGDRSIQEDFAGPDGGGGEIVDSVAGTVD